MIKSKHFRKDVIIARIIFLCFCVLVTAAVAWGVSAMTDSPEGGGNSESESESNVLSSESESEPESESVTEPETETGTEPESQTEPTESEEPLKLYAEVTSNRNLNLRKEPNTTSEVLTSLPKGTKAEVIEELDGWFKVIYNGQEGYISSDFVKIVEE